MERPEGVKRSGHGTLVKKQQSKDRFITEAYDEIKDFPPIVDGKRVMPRR